MSAIAQVGFDAWSSLLSEASHNLHYVVEAVLALFVLFLLFKKSYKVKETPETLSHEEIEQLIAEWQPKPLVEVTPDMIEEAKKRNESMPCITSAIGPRVTLAGEDEKTQFLNFASMGMLDYQVDPQVVDVALATIKSNGVGSCGPRGFYGTIDVHMNLEQRIAKFMGTEEAVLYSSGFATIASVIPAFSKASDYLLVDKGVSLATQIGVSLSRSKTQWFNHNDIKDLKRLLHAMADSFDPKHRVFVVVEGIYMNHGDMAPLPEIVELKKDYPFRLVVEESCSFGVLGKHGRGITEHFGISVKDVDIIAASLGNAAGTIGGFSCGDKLMCGHQRLNSSGYCFSCSLPPFLAQAAIKSLDLMEKGVEINMLQQNVKVLQEALKTVKNLEVSSSAVSPIAHFKLKRSLGDRRKDESALQAIVDGCRTKHQLVLTRSKYVKQERFNPEPSIRFVISAHHTKEEIQNAVAAIDKMAAAAK